ncbi:MAG TPA: AAA family ATPase [Blastocatellia bacterium]|nr:AAA family ATPase [Blastocatellia bacterium]
MSEFEMFQSDRQTGLVKYTRDLTDAALRDELEPVRCRDAETDRVIAILMRQSKNNPVLIGEAGVGKTAVVEGLAQRIVAGRVPQALARARVLMLSHLDLIAGTSFRGQYEKRLQSVIDEASRDAEVILFIDELHNLIGAGSAMGQPLDAANLLKPALSRGELRVIGATTRDEYERYILPDAALERRFHSVEVRELGREQVLEVLRARRGRLEMHHALVITDAALTAALDSSDRSAEYAGRKQPDKAIDLLDEACAIYRLNNSRQPSAEIAGLIAERARLVGVERDSINALLSLAAARGNLLERFSIGTYKALEAMGLGLERLFTGHTTGRPPAPVPDSVRRLEEHDPATRLADAHRDRLLVEDRLREALAAERFVIDAEQVRAASGQHGGAAADEIKGDNPA